MASQLTIHLLNSFQIQTNGEPLQGFHQPRIQAFLAYLLLHRGIPQSRQKVAFRDGRATL
ncbi:hypothetical protein KFU94_22960 [Chloroflexi bacterium TSY]|nr:hypothetical protein [Chloroflexi bacterium TSY]